MILETHKYIIPKHQGHKPINLILLFIRTKIITISNSFKMQVVSLIWDKFFLVVT